MQIVSLQQAERDLEHLLAVVETGTEIVITRDDVPVARLVRGPSTIRTPGTWRDALEVSEDFDTAIDQSAFDPIEP